MLISLQDVDENVAKEACEFWYSMAESVDESNSRPFMEAYLPKLIPILISKMVMTPQQRSQVSDKIIKNLYENI
jgi:hypothetical protein